MTYATSTPMNAPRKYNTIKTNAPDYLLVVLSHYSSKSDGSCLVCLPSIPLPRTSHAHAQRRRFDPARECFFPKKIETQSASSSPCLPAMTATPLHGRPRATECRRRSEYAMDSPEQRSAKRINAPVMPSPLWRLNDDLLADIFLRLPTLADVERAATACTSFRDNVESVYRKGVEA